MAIKRLTPTVRDLGYLHLWRDDIAEIAGYAEQLADVKISMEADQNRLDDVQADLPKIGKRLSYFTLTATRPDEAGQPRQILKVHLAREGCQVEADNPDAETRGIIADIEDAARKCRRLPRSLPNLSSPSASLAKERFVALYLFGGVVGTLLLVVLSAISIGNHATNDTNGAVIPWPWNIFTGIVGGILLVLMVVNEARSRTILTTGTRSEAPTGWQQYRGHIAIAIIFGLVFFILGGLVHF